MGIRVRHAYLWWGGDCPHTHNVFNLKTPFLVVYGSNWPRICSRCNRTTNTLYRKIIIAVHNCKLLAQNLNSILLSVLFSACHSFDDFSLVFLLLGVLFIISSSTLMLGLFHCPAITFWRILPISDFIVLFFSLLFHPSLMSLFQLICICGTIVQCAIVIEFEANSRQVDNNVKLTRGWCWGGGAGRGWQSEKHEQFIEMLIAFIVNFN